MEQYLEGIYLSRPLPGDSYILMAFPGACIYLLDEAGIRRVDYRETEHYCLTRQFLNDPERMLRYLLPDNGE